MDQHQNKNKKLKTHTQKETHTHIQMQSKLGLEYKTDGRIQQGDKTNRAYKHDRYEKQIKQIALSLPTRHKKF